MNPVKRIKSKEEVAEAKIEEQDNYFLIKRWN